MSTEACIALANVNCDESKTPSNTGITGARAFSMPWMSLPAPRIAGSRNAAIRERAAVSITTRVGSWIRIG